MLRNNGFDFTVGENNSIDTQIHNYILLASFPDKGDSTVFNLAYKKPATCLQTLQNNLDSYPALGCGQVGGRDHGLHFLLANLSSQRCLEETHQV